MLSYQHAYHAGNAADLHKHALLASALAYLTRKDKPLSYIETHSGRGLYDLAGAEARKTGEAEAGIQQALRRGLLPDAHPLCQALSAIRTQHGGDAYPGSPLIAGHFLRPGDSAHLAELHPGEYAELRRHARFAKLYRQDGFALAQSLCPPMPRRGMMLIDPSYEIKSDYDRIPAEIASLNRKWNVGVIALWYPILSDGRQAPMADSLRQAHPEALMSEVRFPPARASHGMIGSGMFVVNPPWGLTENAAQIAHIFAKRS